MRNPVFPAIFLAERFARLDFLQLRDVRRGPVLAPRLLPHEPHLPWATCCQGCLLECRRRARFHAPQPRSGAAPPWCRENGTAW